MPRPALEAWTSRGREEPTVGVMHVSKSEIPNDRSAIEREGFAVAVQRGEPPVGWGAWHHHGNHHVVAYVLAGTVHVDAGASGNGSIQASTGDLVYIEPETVHRERYGEGELATVGFYFGSGPGRAEVDGPDRG
jgi:mannose-6-phosphate isomerase-like protein (cupin superfamily)